MKHKKSARRSKSERNLDQDIMSEMGKILGAGLAKEMSRIVTLMEVRMVRRQRLPHEDMERQLIAYARKFMEPYHEIDHYLRVRLFAQVLWKNVGGDLDSIVAAIWLHDIGRVRRGMRDYERVNAEAAYTFLRSIDFCEARRTPVIDAIMLHDKCSGHETDVQRVVRDAHELDAFTCSGLFRCIAERQVLGEDYHFPVIGKRLSGYMHGQADLMTTALGKEIAHSRLKDFLGQLLGFIAAEQALQFRLVATPANSEMVALFDLNRSDSDERDDEKSYPPKPR